MKAMGTLSTKALDMYASFFTHSASINLDVGRYVGKKSKEYIKLTPFRD